MATKSSKSLWTSPMATTASGAFTGALAGPAHAGTADTRTSSEKTCARRVEARAGRRSNFAHPESQLDNPQSLIESIAFAGLLRCILGSQSRTSQQTEYPHVPVDDRSKLIGKIAGPSSEDPAI